MKNHQPKSGQADGGGGGVLDMVGDAPKLSSIPDRGGAGGGSKSSPTGSSGSNGGGGGGVAAAAAAGAGSFMKGAMGFFSPTSLARHKKLLDAEDQRREASLDIMGESSQIIGALKAEVRLCVGSGGDGPIEGWRGGSFSFERHWGPTSSRILLPTSTVPTGETAVRFLC